MGSHGYQVLISCQRVRGIIFRRDVTGVFAHHGPKVALLLSGYMGSPIWSWKSGFTNPAAIELRNQREKSHQMQHIENPGIDE